MRRNAMLARQLAALGAAAVFMWGNQAAAADFGGAPAYQDRYEHTYEDDSFGRHGDDYAYRRDHKAPYGGSIKDGNGGPHGHRYSEYHDRGHRGCVPQKVIRRELRREGWVAIRPLETEGRIATLKARRKHSGRRFILKVHKCSGEIVSVRRRNLREFGAYDRRPWRDDYRRY
jgi:hypothetical protein